MAEAIAIVGYVASLVQLIDFCDKCISKSVELYRSSSGSLDENAAIELAANHIESLRGEITAGATNAPDVALQDLCEAVSEASADLLEALAKLKVQGSKTKWKSIRKALRSIWSKEQIRDLEHRLSTFREELNLHIAVKTKQQLDSLGGDVETHFGSCDARQQAILDAILHQRDVFAATWQDQRVFIQAVGENTRQQIEDSHVTTRAEVRDMGDQVTSANQDEHVVTRQEIRSEGERVELRSQELNHVTVQKIALTEVEILDAINASSEGSQIAHGNTQRQIEELEVAIQELSRQMATRDRELKDLLTAFNESKSQAKKKALAERSQAVTAAILALETMYRSLKAVLAVLQSHAKEMLDAAQSSSLNMVTRYSRRFTTDSGQTRRSANENIRIGNRLRKHRVAPVTSIIGPYAGHDLYYGYYYSNTYESSSDYVNASSMESKWNFQGDPSFDKGSSSSYEGFVVCEAPCPSACLWLLASITMALEVHLSPQEAAFTVMAKALDRTPEWKSRDPRSFNGPFSSRLKADMRYWSAFANMRGMKRAATGDAVDLGLLHPEDRMCLEELVRILLALFIPSKEDRYTDVPEQSVAECIAKTLLAMGLKISLTESPRFCYSRVACRR